MKRLTQLLAVSAALLLTSAAAPAQQHDSAADNPLHTMPIPHLTEAHQMLSVLVGDWQISGRTHKGCPYGEGTFTAKEHNELMPGGMFLVSRTQYSKLFHNSSQIALYGVDPATNNYTYSTYSSMGIKVESQGRLGNRLLAQQKHTLVGNSIVWQSVRTNVNMHGADSSITYTTRMVSPDEYQFTLIAHGIPWFEGTARRVAAIR